MQHLLVRTASSCANSQPWCSGPGGYGVHGGCTTARPGPVVRLRCGDLS